MSILWNIRLIFVFTKKRHWSHSCTTSIQIQLPCLQWNATGPIPVPHQSRSSFRVYKETPLVLFLYHINPDPASVFLMKRQWSYSCTTSIQIQLPCLQWNATGPIPVPHQSRSSFRVFNETPLVPIIYHTKQARIFYPVFFRYIRILIELLRPSLAIVSFPSGFRTQPYLLYTNKIHLLGNIYRNILDYASSGVFGLWLSHHQGKKFKIHEYVYFLINECTSYSCIPSCTRYCRTRHGMASSSVILVHSEHLLMTVHTHTGLSRTIPCTVCP